MSYMVRMYKENVDKKTKWVTFKCSACKKALRGKSDYIRHRELEHKIKIDYFPFHRGFPL